MHLHENWFSELNSQLGKDYPKFFSKPDNEVIEFFEWFFLLNNGIKNLTFLSKVQRF